MHVRFAACAGGSLLSLLLPGVAAFAQQETLQVNVDQSQVHFVLPDPLHAVDGLFHMQGGSVTFDAGGRIAGLLTVDAGSGNSGNKGRDKKMTEDELKAASYSTITFAPSRYTGTLAPSGASAITVDGVFTLLGKPHDIEVPMKVSIDGRTCTATGTFNVPYVEWGLKDPSNFLLHVGKVVTIQMTLVGTLTEAAGR